jgi:hypothetical protein
MHPNKQLKPSLRAKFVISLLVRTHQTRQEHDNGVKIASKNVQGGTE